MAGPNVSQDHRERAAKLAEARGMLEKLRRRLDMEAEEDHVPLTVLNRLREMAAIQDRLLSFVEWLAKSAAAP